MVISVSSAIVVIVVSIAVRIPVAGLVFHTSAYSETEIVLVRIRVSPLFEERQTPVLQRAFIMTELICTASFGAPMTSSIATSLLQPRLLIPQTDGSSVTFFDTGFLVALNAIVYTGKRVEKIHRKIVTALGNS